MLGEGWLPRSSVPAIQSRECSGMDIIEVDNVRKSYGDNEAVGGISLRVGEGEVVALLGPNGAGKTTTVEILEGYRKRDSGSVSVLGMDPWHAGSAFRSRVGLVLQECALPPGLTVLELLTLYAAYYEHARSPKEVLALVGLEGVEGMRVRKLSGGQQRRIDLALALIGDPALIFLDEPTTGFDPGARRSAWEIVKGMQSIGKTVVLTTHYMDEAYALASRLYIIARGKVVEEGTPDAIIQRSQRRTRITFSHADVHELPPVEGDVQRDGGSVVVETDVPLKALHTLTGWAIDNTVNVENLEVKNPSLEDVYLELTNA